MKSKVNRTMLSRQASSKLQHDVILGVLKTRTVCVYQTISFWLHNLVSSPWKTRTRTNHTGLWRMQNVMA